MSDLVDPNPGNVVVFDGREFLVTRAVDADSVQALDKITGAKVRLRIGNLTGRNPEAAPPPAQDFAAATPREEERSKRRLDAIEPLLRLPRRSFDDVKRRAEELNVHFTTLYRWLRKFERSARKSSLLDCDGRGNPGQSRLGREREGMVEQVVDTCFLTDEAPRVSHAWEQLQLLARDRGLDCPSLATLRRRIYQLPARTLDERRAGKDTARRFDPIVGRHTDGKRPLANVQIDHVELDIVLVDSVRRRDVGRPWLTLAIDSYSRMIVGYYLAFEAPCAHSAGQCVANVILHKQPLLERLGLGECVWPCYGVPASLLLDNAMEFHGYSLLEACGEYGIVMNFRPPGKPHYGGIVERLAETLSHGLHALPGTTKSNPSKRRSYDSGKNAVLTIDELERLIVDLFIAYHRTYHRGIKETPLRRWSEGVMNGVAGGLPAYPIKRDDTERVRFDFLPLERRTIQRSGVEIENIFYQDGALARFIGKDPKTGKSPEFSFKRDPHDVRVIYFKDPNTQNYIPIYAQGDIPKTTLWEWRIVQDELKGRRKEGERIDKDARLDSVKRRNEIIEQARGETKRSRRMSEHRIQSRRKALTASFPSSTNVIPFPEAVSEQGRDVKPAVDDAWVPTTFDVKDLD